MSEEIKGDVIALRMTFHLLVFKQNINKTWMANPPPPPHLPITITNYLRCLYQLKKKGEHYMVQDTEVWHAAVNKEDWI